MAQGVAFAFGVPPDLNAFYRYTWSSTPLCHTQAYQLPPQHYGWAVGFYRGLGKPPTHPLRPVIPINARTLRITAAAGT